MRVGQPVSIGWNWSGRFAVAGAFDGRIEAVGCDWLIVRDRDGVPRAAVFTSQGELLRFFAELDA